jgi:hypothetical protein
MDVAWYQHGADRTSYGQLCTGSLFKLGARALVSVRLFCFFVAGVALPAISLFAARRLRWVVNATTVWMLATLVGFVWFGMMSGGGV